MERTTRKEWGIEDIGITPSARAEKKPVTLREGKQGSENPSFQRDTRVGLLSLIRAGLKPMYLGEGIARGPRIAKPYRLEINPVPLVGEQ